MPGVGDMLHLAVYVLAGVAAIEAGAIAVLSALFSTSREAKEQACES